ncbi:MAG: LCP family protein [Lachnospiraceae bacterium]|nr:LCP family protein [Lachnospiraceae bacterium]
MKTFIKQHKFLTLILTILTLILLTLACATWFIFAKLSKLNYHDGTLTTEQQGLLTTEQSSSEITTSEDDTATEEALISSEEAGALAETEVILAEGDVYSDDDIFNILLLGTDERTANFSTNARADSIMILSLNKKANTMKLVSLQRGMGFPILEGTYQGQYEWITHLFRYGGADLMLRSIREVLHVDVEHYVRVNFHTFEQLIDSVGGVDVELTATEVSGLNGEVRTNARTRVKVTEGVNHLDGYDALQYSRLRYTDSDWKRIQRQRNVIQSVVTNAKGMNLLEINSMLDTVLPLVQTNLTSTDILGLVGYAPAVLGMEMEQMTIPASGTYGSMTGLGGRTLYAVDFQTNSELLHEFLYGSED